MNPTNLTTKKTNPTASPFFHEAPNIEFHTLFREAVNHTLNNKTYQAIMETLSEHKNTLLAALQDTHHAGADPANAGKKQEIREIQLDITWECTDFNDYDPEKEVWHPLSREQFYTRGGGNLQVTYTPAEELKAVNYAVNLQLAPFNAHMLARPIWENDHEDNFLKSILCIVRM